MESEKIMLTMTNHDLSIMLAMAHLSGINQEDKETFIEGLKCYMDILIRAGHIKLNQPEKPKE